MDDGRRKNVRIAALDIGGTSIKSGIWTGGLAEEVREEATEAKKADRRDGKGKGDSFRLRKV